MVRSPRAGDGTAAFLFTCASCTGMKYGRGISLGKTGRHVLITGAACLFLALAGCASGGRVLHVDNRETVPYTTQDAKLKRRIVRALVRRHLLTGAQQYTCQVNIMEIGRYYVLEVWPEGTKSADAFGVKLKKPFLVPVEKYSGTR
ncbi:MAG: hypothetical protein JW863_20385 [Chitinispirillaceae bacterium]|nr:hypothetical protein [Chitinispirillaceae bacterium]